MYLKALWIKNSVFIRKLLELMPDLEFWNLIVLQYCSFQLDLYWNALFWSLLLYQCSFVFLYLKALWIKNSVFIRKLLELMPDLEFWNLIVLQYCSFQLDLYWNALFWSLLLYQCSFVVWSSQDASIDRIEILSTSFLMLLRVQ